MVVNRKYRGISKAMTAIIVVIIIAIVAVAGGYEYYISNLPKKPTTPALSGSITVVAQAGENDVALAQIAKNFEQLHPGVTVNIVSISFGNALTDYLTAFSENQDAYDIIYFPNIGWLGKLEPYLLNLTPYINNPSYFPPSYNFSDILPSMINQFKFGNTLYAIPYLGDVMMFYYIPSYFTNTTNQALFKQEYGYNLPNPGNTTITLKQLVDIANFFNGKHGSKYGIVMMNDEVADDMMETFTALFAAARVNMSSVYGPVTATYGELFTSSGKLLKDTPIFIQTLNYFAALENDSANEFNSGFLTTPETFGTGVAPMMIYWTPAMLSLQNSSIKGQWAIAKAFPGGVSNLGGVAYGIYKYTKNLPLALSFLEFATSQNQSVYYMTLDDLLPFRYSMFTYGVQHGIFPASDLNAMESYLSNAVQGEPNLPNWPPLLAYMQAEIAQVATMKITPSQAASAITSYAASQGIPIYSG
jgi:ABC-type glycerol-3-phosphate transport system substrate-binding protein